MLDLLREFEKNLQEPDFRFEFPWKGLYIDYTPPIVERVFTTILLDKKSYRLNLHRIHPCEDAYYHPHPWPSAVHVYSGQYEMGIGYGKGHDSPPLAAKVVLSPGSLYEMTDPDGWHYVKVLGKTPSLSVMLTGMPWGRELPVIPKQDLRELSQKEIDALLDLFIED